MFTSRNRGRRARRFWGGLATVALVVPTGVVLASGSPAGATSYGSPFALPFTGLIAPHSGGVAVDGTGDVFRADTGTNTVVELSPGGVQTTVMSGLNGPHGVAVDSAGDVFVTDTENSQVLELVKNGPLVTLPLSVLIPYGVAVDAAGDVFVADYGNSRVVELPKGGTQKTVPFVGLYPNGSPGGLAVDSAGDVFAADTFNDQILEMTTGGVQRTLPFSGLGDPYGVAVDGSGDVFVADNFHGRMLELPAGGTSQITLPFGSTLDAPLGAAVDNAGDVFAGNDFGDAVVELPALVETSTSLVASANPVVYGHSVTFTATVAVTFGPNHPMGSVTFADGSTVLGTIALNGVGFAQWTSPSLSAGNHSITATYSGDDHFATSSGSLIEVVQRAATTIVPKHEGLLYSSLSATLKSATGVPISGALVTFTKQGIKLGTATTNASGVATFSIFGVSVGGTYSASFAGNGNYLPSSGSAPL